MKTLLATSSSVLMALFASMGVVSATGFATVLPAWAERLGWTLVHSVWQLALTAFFVALTSTLLRRVSARVQYTCYVAALITMAALPCVTWALIEITPQIVTENQSDSVKFEPNVEIPEVDLGNIGVAPSSDDMASMPFASRLDHERPEVSEPDPLASDVRDVPAIPHDAALIPAPIPSTSIARETRQPTRWEKLIAQVRSVVEPRLPLFVALWFVGVAFCSLRPIWGLWTQWRLRCIGLSQVSAGLQHSLVDLARRMGVTRVVRIAQSAYVTAPMVVGYLKPIILLPASVLTGLTPDQLESLLAHELAHVRRHDWLVNAIQVVVETLLFYHPAVWWLSQRIRDERELCCDDIALTIVGDRATYGRMLLALEELRHTNPLGTLVSPATMAATGGSLVARIRRLMPVPREMERTQRGWLSGAVALLMLAVSCGVWFATYATAENGNLVRQDESTSEDSTDEKRATEEPPDDKESSDSASRPRSDQATAVSEAKVDPTADALRYIAGQRVGAKDWPQWCGSNHRNNTPSGRNIPIKWDLETGENVLWKTEHGRGNLTTPVVANGKVFVGGNNLPELVKRYPKNVDLGCLRAYSAETGEFLWQASHSKLSLGNGETDRSRDWPMIGICSPPTVEGTRLWYVSNRCEVVCVDTEGFRDGKNDGPIVDETDRDPTDADFIWRTDLVKDFGVVPHYASASTVLCVGERCFVITSNGVGEDHQKVLNPEAPSFVCLDKNTGKVLWTDNSPGGNILAGCWSSPCAFEINGETQIVMPGGDGWLYSFTPEGDGQGHAKLLWKFDGNPKESRFLLNQRSTRNSILATPAFYDGLVYVGVGENPEHGEGVGRLWCIDPTKRGDVSQELAVDTNDQPLPPRRIQVVDRAKGERAIPNPNSAAVWCYTHDVAQTKNGKPKFEGTMHRTLGNVAIKNDLMFIADFCGLLHCVDAKQTVDGQPVVYWTHDMFASVWGTPLIVEDKVYVCDDDGDVLIFALSKTRQLIAEPSCIAPIETTPIVANDTLYITAQDRLIAIRKKQPADPNPKPAGVDAAEKESGDAQMLAWALIVDGTLADSVAKLGSNELPQQGAYRVIRLDAAKLRQTMFDPAVQDHVYSELQPPQSLRLSSRADDRQNFHWSPFFQMKQNIGSVSGLIAAEYVVFPGQPFDIQFQHSSLSILAFEGSPPPTYEVNQKSLNFRGEMPVGSAVAFIAKAQSKTGKQDFREVLVFEAVPKLSEQAERLLRDVTWFKAGRAREREALRQSVEFNTRATKLPDELPPKWTKPLPHGGSVSLVAVARPATHPFCWWDPDGKPCATDWSLQQHAFGSGELIALVCIRDPDRTDFERQGVSYMVTGRNPPLPLYRPWNEAAPKDGRDDSELFLFSVYNTDDEQRPMIGINSGVGPWKELGRLPMKEEVTFGRADYILGGMNREPDQSVYRSLGRRYLPDEDIRLRLIDKQGKSHPFHPSMVQSNVSDTRGIPFGWDGWGTFETQQVKEKDLDRIMLDARGRHWTTFSGFATELNNSNGNEPPKLTIAPPVAPVVRTLSGRLGSRFNAILRARYSSFLSDDDRAALVDDLKRFTERHQPTTLTADRASLIVNGLDEVLRQNVDYLSFFPMYQTLKWRLWMALQQRNLSPDELARREEQREEIRKLIRAIPIKDFHITRTHGHAIGQLDQWFEDPWHGWFYEPMSDEQLLQWKRDQKNWTINDVNTAASNHNAMVMQVKQSSMKDNPHLGTGALPLDAEVIASLKSGLLRYQTRYSSAEAFYGTHDLVFDEAPKPDRRIFDWSKTFVDLPETLPPGLEAVQKWAEENKTGLLAYESARHGLFMLRGAKLGLLPVETWHEADRLSDDELFRIVGEQAKDSILLADHYGPRPKERGYGPPPPGPLLVVESASGELGVLRVKSISNSGITAHLRVRPGAKRKVVAQAEVRAITVGMTQSQVIAIKGKHYRETVGQRAGQVIHVYDDMAVYYESPAKDPKSSLIEKPLNPSWQEALKDTAYADADTLAPGGPGLERPRDTPGLPSQSLSPEPATQPPADPKEKNSTKKEAARKDDAKEVRKRVVRVVDEDKQPIVGARVLYQFENHRSIFVSPSQFKGLGLKAETEKSGEFSEEIPEGAERVMITVRADGFGTFSETQGADVSTVVTMKRGRVVHVRAVDGEGKILKQAVPLLNEHRVWGREFVQQKDGTLKSPSVALNRKLMRVAAAQDAGPMLFSELIDVSTAKPGDDGVLQLTLNPGTRIEGKLDDSVPRPVSEGYVELCLVEAENHTLGRPAWMWNDFTPVKPDGTFVFESVPGGGHAQIHVLVDGYISKKPTAESLKEYMLAHKLADEKVIAQQFEHFDHRAMRGLFVALNQPVVTVTVACEPTASCDFLVLDPSGKPVPDVEVRFNPNGAFTFGRLFNPFSLSYESLLVEELHKHRTATWNWNTSLPHGREAKQQHDWMNKWIDRVKSDAQGRVRVRNLPGRGRESFHVEAKEYALPISPLLNEKDIAKRSLNDQQDRYAVVDLLPGETVEKTIYLERKQPVVDREFSVIDANGKPLENVELSVAEMRVGAKEWQTWSTQRFGELPKGATDNSGRVVLRVPSKIDKKSVTQLRLGINFEFKNGLWLHRQVVEVPLKPDDGVIALHPNPEVGRAGRAVYGKLDDLLAKSSPKEWLDVMIKGPTLAVLRKLLAASKIKHPEPVELLDDGRRGSDEKGNKVKVVNTDDTQFAIVSARVRPMGGALANESDPSKLPECAFVFDMEGTFIAALGGKLGTTRSNDPEDVDIVNLGPNEDWFVRVTKFENNGSFEYQSDYYRIANPIVPAMRCFHYANSNSWSNGPEKITRWGTLYFDFPKLSDKFDSPGYSGDGGPAQTADGVPVIRQIMWDGDRNRFVGAAAQFGKGKGLYDVDLNWSKEFEAVVPKPNQLFVTGGEREYDHWHSWYTVVPDNQVMLLRITIPQAEGESKVIEKKLASGKRHIQVQLKPNKDNTSARLELRLNSETPEVSELPIQLGDRPDKHPQITQLLSPGDSARLIECPLKSSTKALIVEIKLPSTGPAATNDAPKD